MFNLPFLGPAQPNLPSATIRDPLTGHTSLFYERNVGPRRGSGWDPFGMNRPNMPSGVIKDAATGRTEKIVYER